MNSVCQNSQGINYLNGHAGKQQPIFAPPFNFFGAGAAEEAGAAKEAYAADAAFCGAFLFFDLPVGL